MWAAALLKPPVKPWWRPAPSELACAGLPMGEMLSCPCARRSSITPTTSFGRSNLAWWLDTYTFFIHPDDMDGRSLHTIHRSWQWRPLQRHTGRSLLGPVAAHSSVSSPSLEY